MNEFSFGVSFCILFIRHIIIPEQHTYIYKQQQQQQDNV